MNNGVQENFIQLNYIKSNLNEIKYNATLLYTVIHHCSPLFTKVTIATTFELSMGIQK